MAPARTRSDLGRGGCFASACGWGARGRGKLGRQGSGRSVAGRGKARMFPNNEIIAGQSEQLNWDTCLTVPRRKENELVSGKLGCQERPKSDMRKWDR